MTDHPTEPVAGSGNRWEPTTPPPASPPLDSSVPPAPPAPPIPPGAPPAAGPRRVPRPGREFWWGFAGAAVIVLVAATGFLVGRASVDDHGGPVQIQRQFPQDGGRQFGDSVPPGGVPQPQG